MNKKQLIVALAGGLIILFTTCSSGCETSKLAYLDIKVGIERARVESIIAEALNTENKYSPYGNNLQGGIVQYTDGRFILEIKYKAGAPAPYIKDKQGNAVHFPPTDETVESIKFYKK